ncbi:PREDICTED: uncharacterized protein LOC109155665 [Ipomoea nil]|uniref:uncharacterized protein LOC109155665 n=1 Tax=Ipomoea nil TaxID=35883 RepID=UPI000901E289|nr:PREDICTED: uncharacterized protein LOC109155665 [Ipomoea nil]
MAAEHSERVINLFDSLWFEHEILTSLKSSNSQTQQVVEEPAAANNLCRTPTFMVRSLSEQRLSSKESLESETHSPKSVLSGSPKEYLGFPESNVGNEAISSGFSRSMRRRKSRSSSRSLSELEFEEVKGFMDLGFVFSDDQDKDPTLVSIIPGLQRRGIREGGDKDAMVSRPYLSEAWSVMEEQRKPLMKTWRFPAASGCTEMEIKDQLRCWAHTVASTVVI